MLGDRMATCIVIDTNVWIREQLLKSPLGIAFLHLVRINGWKVAVPEVVRGEVEAVSVRHCRDAVKKIKDSFGLLHHVIGRLVKVYIPDEREIKDSIDAVFEDMSSCKIDVEFTLEHARSALKRVIAGTPPNGEKNQQYKDSVVWEAILSLLGDYDVFFVTEDKAFYHNGMSKDGRLSMPLKEESDAKLHQCKIYESLRVLVAENKDQLESISVSFQVDALSDYIVSDVNNSLRGWGFFALSVAIRKFDVYITEDKDVIAIIYDVECEVEHDSSSNPQGFGSGNMFGVGECRYDLSESEFFDNIISSVKIKCLDKEGVERTLQVASANTEHLFDDVVNYTLKKHIDNIISG